jgi:hypothetical protein
MKDKRIKRERCLEDELQKYFCFITILLHYGLIYITIIKNAVNDKIYT